MPKSENQKLKLLYIVKILEEKTDSEHGITLSQLLKELDAYGISAERKSLYSDIESLKQFGYDIVGEKCYRNYYYKLVSRDFELAELKLLVDSVQSSKFITEKKEKGGREEGRKRKEGRKEIQLETDETYSFDEI